MACQHRLVADRHHILEAVVDRLGGYSMDNSYLVLLLPLYIDLFCFASPGCLAVVSIGIEQQPRDVFALS